MASLSPALRPGPGPTRSHKVVQVQLGNKPQRRGRHHPPRASTDVQQTTAPAASAAAASHALVDVPAQAPQQQLSLHATLVQSITSVGREEWDACAMGTDVEFNPFVSWDFLRVMEESESACAASGWLPQHLLLRRGDANGQLLGCCPLYLKGHSYGEYVFDQSWADAYHRLYHQPYYPKLQSCVPFSPVPGPRLLVAPGPEAPAVRRALADTLRQVAVELGVSSLHITFPTERDWLQLGERHGYLQRTGIQYHFHNASALTGGRYTSFDGGEGSFLAALRQGKRKSIRQERKRAGSAGLRLVRLRGEDIRPRHWEAFHSCYLNTTDRKWGSAYLTRAFFPMLGEALGDKVLLVVAETPEGRPGEGKLVAGALNLVGSHALFGRNWGCIHGDRYPGLHFELCYYQALEFAIQEGLDRVEAGAQGEHKIARGFLPHPTYSAHFLPDQPQGDPLQGQQGRGWGMPAPAAASWGGSFSDVVGRYLRQERADVEYTLELLDQEASPYKLPPPVQRSSV